MRKLVNEKRYSLLNIIIPALALCLNQACVALGINLSLSDLFLVIAMTYLVCSRRMAFPIIPTIYFLVLSSSVLGVSVSYVPSKFYFTPSSTSLGIEYIKLVVIFSYFLLGFNSNQPPLVKRTLKTYSIGAALVGLLGTIAALLHPTLLTVLGLSDGLRFQGMMNDPNFFAVLQVSAIAYFTRARDLTFFQRTCGCCGIVLSILLSGSKTGTATLLFYVSIRALAMLLTTWRTRAHISHLTLLTIIILFLVSISGAMGLLPIILSGLASIVPAYERIQFLFTDLPSAFSRGGSDRNTTWLAATGLITRSPIMGVGIATYINLAQQMYAVDKVAHNTYLQLIAEWGGLWTTIFLLYVLRLLTLPNQLGETNTILKEIIIVFLIGSLGISLNNARMFWLFLGMATSLANSRVTDNPTSPSRT